MLIEITHEQTRKHKQLHNSNRLCWEIFLCFWENRALLLLLFFDENVLKLIFLHNITLILCEAFATLKIGKGNKILIIIKNYLTRRIVVNTFVFKSSFFPSHSPSHAVLFIRTQHPIVRFLATNDFIIRSISIVEENRRQRNKRWQRLQGDIFTFARASSGSLEGHEVIEYLSVVSKSFAEKALDS